MVSNKEILAKRLQQNTQKHQHAQKEHINDVKELRRMYKLQIFRLALTSLENSLINKILKI